jgi:phage terminase large subunit GpA-like protein
MQVFFNTRLAESFEPPGSKQKKWEDIKKQAGGYSMMEVPDGVLLLSMGVDTHDDRLVCVIRGFGKEEESWLIYFGEFFGDPNQEVVWNHLDSLINRPYQKKDGITLHMSSVAIDIGGHRMDAVKRFCKQRDPLVIPVFGMAPKIAPLLGRPKAQDINYGGLVQKKGVFCWPVGTYALKQLIYSRLDLTGNGARVMHFPTNTPDEYFMQLTSEQLQVSYKDGYPVQKWVVTRPGGRNEALDCEVYARAGIERIISTSDFNVIELGLKKSVSQNRNIHKQKSYKKGGWW